jgi:hypothetical protein
MASIDGVDKVKQALNRLAKERFVSSNSIEGNSVIVGYTASYALYVHEQVEIPHKPGKQAKYLEQPARELKNDLAQIVRTAVLKGMELQQALYLAGLRLQRESQKIVPIDTGNLKGSAFTRKE